MVCKAPRPGFAKTRLATRLGPEGAAALAAAFIRDTAATLTSLPVVPWLVHAPPDAAPELAALLPTGFRGHAQTARWAAPAPARTAGNGAGSSVPAPPPVEAPGARVPDALGAIMHDALRAMLDAGHPTVFLVGADAPDAPPALYRAALATLADPAVDAVFGPTADGGYWLVGVRALQPLLFRDIAWSTPGVMEQTRAAARAAGLRLALLDPWFDVDEPDDLDALKARLAAAPASVAMATRAALAAWSAVPSPTGPA